MPIENPTESFIRSLTESQNRLHGYIYSLLGNAHAAADVLQECNLVLWRKFGEFRPEGDFLAWAFGIARFQVMAYLRDRHREQKRLLLPELVDLLHDELAHSATQSEVRVGVLRQCLDRLPPKSRALVDLRYFRNQSMEQIAAEIRLSLSATKVALLRVRRALKTCIESRGEDGSPA
ncbi:MAG: polymerase sigma factor SigL [Verrucomicrobiota bacterium]|jgi:RNA polymerase sigma-70 factor (ECF subfamily)